jgi:hypothetical protein
MAGSPWGQIDYSTVFAPGIRSVGTSGHGGIMISPAFAAAHLSEAAISRAMVYGSGEGRRLCYEEDCDYAIPFLELLDTLGDKFYAHCGPDSKCATQEGRRQSLLSTLSHYNPEYLIERGIEPLAEEYANWKKWQEKFNR